MDLVWLRDTTGWPGGSERAEEVLEGEIESALASTVVPLDVDEMRRAASKVTTIYLDLAPEVV